MGARAFDLSFGDLSFVAPARLCGCEFFSQLCTAWDPKARKTTELAARSLLQHGNVLRCTVSSHGLLSILASRAAKPSVYQDQPYPSPDQARRTESIIVLSFSIKRAEDTNHSA